MDWFRWWHGTVTDPKFQWVARKSGQTVANVLAVWSCLLEHASTVTQCNADVTRGNVEGFDCNDFDVLLGFEDGVTQSIFDRMTEKGLIDSGYIAKWNERQPKREDSSAERVAAHRAKKKAEVQADDVTQRNAPEKKRLDTDTEKNKSKAESAPATRLPADWLPSGEDIAFCQTERPDLDVIATESRFRDYWIAQPGAKGKKTDWPATWRNWVRNERIQPARASPQGYESEKDKQRRLVAEQLKGAKHGQQPTIIDIN